ncbi:MAG TPA: peptidyl-alpha-hydroxyglycine alpha-amidating lyase family protein [Steroidobacteraceae bacterium]|jgi:streptogramin lyase|nr:peptidyl-alpha-hydroxyglycine alpha-amidating lyase family protein [Steroidobacteraceae bacterium]
MRRFLLQAFAGACFCASAFGQSVPEIAFDSTPDFFKLPEGMYFGEVSGVAVNSKKHVFVLSRGNTSGPAYGAAAAQLLEFDSAGKFVREIGKNLYAWSFAHAVRVDRYDNVWVADKGSDVVVRFDPQGRVTRVFGRKVEASDEGAHPLEHPKPPLPPVDGYFRQVTDMTWDSNDNVYISDGYINSRVAKYDKDGNWVGSWGEPGSGPGQFNQVHSIASDSQNRIYVADRFNQRIQIFDTSGKLLNTIKIDVPAPPNSPVAIGSRPTETSPGHMHPGSPWALCITPGPVQYLYVSDAYPGRIYKLTLDGKILGWLGGSGKTLKKFGWIHEMACPSENELYVAEILNWRAQKLTLHP